MTLSEELQWRGFVNQTTFTDITELDKESRTFYLGIDPSASSMTIGNLAVVMMVRHFISHGHKAILLVGGATGMIGDPDGKKQERDLLTLEQIDANKKAIAAQYKQVLGDLQFEVVDNYDWFKDIGYLDFLRDVGKHVPMRVMLGREFVQSRLGEDGAGISYAEFSYSLIQGYDFVHLFRDKGVTLQICGADQWGNSIAGVDLIRRMEGAEAHIWSAPLVINKTTGVKFGKSEDGAVWLDPSLTSAYKFYQFWLNADDEGAADYLKIYTALSKEEIEKVLVEFEHDRSGRLAQRTLAYEVTKLVHGKERADGIVRVVGVLFGGVDFTELTPGDLQVLEREIPVVNLVPTSSGGKDTSATEMVSAVLQKAGIVESLGKARKLIEGGGISVNGKKIEQDFMLSTTSLVKKGKYNFVLVRQPK
jgi:tyrosyl-tRNA synthetase